MTPSESVGFKINHSQHWVFLNPNHVTSVFGGGHNLATICTVDGNEFTVAGEPDAIAAIIWPVKGQVYETDKE